jgi:hypothetical protein
MGVIKLKRDFGFMHKGYSYGTDILYVYCDACGSFNIAAYWGIRKILLLLICLGVITVGTLISYQAGKIYCSGPMFSLIICVIVIKIFWGEANYRCRKCGNSHILVNNPKELASQIDKFNTRNYPANMEIIDVPDKLTQKRYQGYWSDEYQ